MNIGAGWMFKQRGGRVGPYVVRSGAYVRKKKGLRYGDGGCITMSVKRGSRQSAE